jgi:hypothetical protein
MKIGRNDPCTGERKRFGKMGGSLTSARKKIFPACM